MADQDDEWDAVPTERGPGDGGRPGAEQPAPDPESGPPGRDRPGTDPPAHGPPT